MAKKQNTSVAANADSVKQSKSSTAQPKVADSSTTSSAALDSKTKENAAVKKADKHNHDAERMRNSKLPVLMMMAKDVDNKKGGKKTAANNTSLLELSIKDSAVAKANKNKRQNNNKGDKKTKSF